MLTGLDKSALLLKILSDANQTDIMGRIPESQLSTIQSRMVEMEAPDEATLNDFVKEVLTHLEPSSQDEELLVQDDIDFEMESDSDEFGEGDSDEAEDKFVKGAGPDYEKIATQLSSERPQLISFFVNRLEPEEKEKIIDHLPVEVTESLKDLDSEDLPVSDKLFKVLRATLFGESPQN